MSATAAIAKREIRTYFNAPVAYIVVTVFTMMAGYLFFAELFVQKQADLRGFFHFAALLFMFIAPAITMRLLAEEKGSGTIELLITMPVRDWEVVVGKFLASLALLGASLALTLVFAFTTASLGSLDMGPTIGGYLGLLFIGSAYLAIGVMASAMTRNQIVAFILSFAICFGLYLIGAMKQMLPESLQGIADFISLVEHFENVGRGVIDSRDVIYYLSVIGGSLFIATTALESRKWK